MEPHPSHLYILYPVPNPSSLPLHCLLLTLFLPRQPLSRVTASAFSLKVKVAKRLPPRALRKSALRLHVIQRVLPHAVSYRAEERVQAHTHTTLAPAGLSQSGLHEVLEGSCWEEERLTGLDKAQLSAEGSFSTPLVVCTSLSFAHGLQILHKVAEPSETVFKR